MKYKILSLLILLTWLGSASAATFMVNDVSITEQNEAYRLNARIDYRLTEEVQEALSNGVPLTLRVELVVGKIWRSFWEPNPLSRTLRFQIRYHALTELYRVVDMQTGEEQSFVTQHAALYALGEIGDMLLVSHSALIPGEPYQLHLRADLEIESLPLPLQPLAYLGRGWRLTTGWTRWPLQP
ncbi:MAG: DUF4390 domain-containing protein [Candidatus Thiodiazotropha sp. (ex Myrtea spinifera)]|nr:DUF4390 domain-containing protein [Candidatus Thiodiazotropha sp. (ex Myrtea spinifera)]